MITNTVIRNVYTATVFKEEKKKKKKRKTETWRLLVTTTGLYYGKPSKSNQQNQLEADDAHAAWRENHHMHIS